MKIHDIHEAGADAGAGPHTAPTDEPIPFPITNELDLHTFRPSDIGDLLPEYFTECIKRGILTVRVIHGKGTGALREGVHHLLDKLPQVASWQWPAAPHSGHWGATYVWLRPDAA